MGVDQIGRAELIEHGGIARKHGFVAPILESFDFVDRYIVVWHKGYVTFRLPNLGQNLGDIECYPPIAGFCWMDQRPKLSMPPH